MLSASTRIAAVIGDPVAHSLSPRIHNAAFAATGLDWAYVAFHVREGAAPDAVAAMRALGIGGLSVTMPHKAAVLSSLDELSDDARALGAVNCISRRDGRLVGDNTDGAGFLAGLRDDFGLDPDGCSCVVLGAGGAARAVVRALAGAGARSVAVVNRTPDRAADAAALAGPAGRVGPAELVADADLVVNATPVGMGGTGDPAALPLDASLLGRGQVVAELIYHPARTPLMVAAEAAGARTANGTSMLVQQAAVAFEAWTGVTAPVAAMRAAVAGFGGSSPDPEPKS